MTPKGFQTCVGGPDFLKNSGPINRFYKETRAARNVVVAIKSRPFGIRVKGLLLEAMVWRLAAFYSFPPAGRGSAGPEELNRESFALFLLAMWELQQWRTSPAFGAELVRDLNASNPQMGKQRWKKYVSQLDAAREEIRQLAWPVMLDPYLAQQTKWRRRLEKKLPGVRTRSAAKSLATLEAVPQQQRRTSFSSEDPQK